MTLKKKGFILVLITIIMVVISTFFIVEKFKSSMVLEEQKKVQNLVETAYGVLQYYERMSVEKRMTQTEAQEKAKETIKGLRYQGGREYFWINDTQHIMIMHPYMSELEGRDLTGYEDAKGKRIFKEFVDIVNRQGEGFAEYYWPKPGETIPVSKISYVKEFKPWGWIIGSGMYLDNLNKEVGSNIKLLVIVISIFGILYATTVLVFIKGTSTDLKNLTEVTTDLPNKLIINEDICWPKSTTTEIDTLIQNFKDMSSKLKQNFEEIERDKEKLKYQTQKLIDANNELEVEIAERKQTEIEMVEAREAALKASKAKSQFLATMSHEIRTPMNAIIGMSDLLCETELSEEQKEYIEIFRRAGNNLLNLINDILDVSKIEAGYLTLESVEFNLMKLVKKTMKIFDSRVHEKGLVLEYKVDSDIPECLIGDPGRLRQIIINLVDNAIKFTESGEITLNVGLQSIDNERCLLKFNVADTGIGISKDEIKEVFRGFRQADSSISRKYGGTGLGLTICRQLVELLGGEIYVESEVGMGSIFSFTAEFRIMESCSVILNAENSQLTTNEKTVRGVDSEAAAALVDESDLNIKENLKILLVEDSEDNILLIQFYIKNTKYNLDIAQDGKEALDKFKLNEYDIVLMDVQLPIMDGYTATKEMRKWEKEKGRREIPIIALTAYGFREDIERSTNAGCTAHLIKPIKKEVLLVSIVKYTKGVGGNVR